MRSASLVLGFLLLTLTPLCGQQGKDYAPVAPASAVHAGLNSQLKLVRDWIDEKDYASAAQAAQGLEVLAVLASYHGDAGWKKSCLEIVTLSRQLADTARQKNAQQCNELTKNGQDRLMEMARTIPSVKSPAAPPRVGSTKIWMLLADGTYVDAKSARSPAELQQLAHLLAEEANGMAHLRADWDKLAVDVRDAALAVVQETQSGGLDAGKKALKGVYQRCEACHQRNKR